MYKYKRC